MDGFLIPSLEIGDPKQSKPDDPAAEASKTNFPLDVDGTCYAYYRLCMLS